MYKAYIKRVADIVLSVLGIAFLALPMAVIALLIKITDPGPVLFRQQRVGRDKKLFEMYKFRSMSMSTPKDCPTHLLYNPGQYITPIGKILRKTSLDELPQLFNILAGHMSVVGPRPALWNQQDLTSHTSTYGTQIKGENVELDYVVGLLTDSDGLMTDFQIESARTTPIEARKGYRNTWLHVAKGGICDPTEKCILYIMADPSPSPTPTSAGV